MLQNHQLSVQKGVETLLQWKEKEAHHKNSSCFKQSKWPNNLHFFYNGRRHDFRLFKESKLKIDPEIKTVVDIGYTGIIKFHANSVIPVKRSKKKPLTKTEKMFKRRVSSERVLNEQVISLIKRFKIVSDRYRNRRKRFSLRFNLICDICNYEKRIVTQEV